MNTHQEIVNTIQASIDVKKAILSETQILEQIETLANSCILSLKKGGKVIFAGNGGSFADSQHLSAELVSRLQFDRGPLASIALGTNSSSMSAIANDYGYDKVFARELDSIANAQDVFIPISTSGNSPNIIAAIGVGLTKGLNVIGFTGQSGGKMADLCTCIKVPSNRTERIQESHIMIGHIVCALVETGYFKQ
ncbi:phosphoheptose isomerase [Leptospira perolatii]|uniref:Phosphoheptose isomerase n=1 Tax=Leptospira perolatii TaxID=2023191 RepID=A0A2M9ZLL2_9LEPT|nr:SIS domain-containing protein [Leptospira perolatii]PJZ70283.1 phosphoheptose isomerase [Leptospira perolatii]PJZ72833.1 phosphoheptose isomerase [Leptospira perolatii]